MMTNQRAVVMEEVMTAMMAMTGMMVEMEGGEEEDEEEDVPTQGNENAREGMQMLRKDMIEGNERANYQNVMDRIQN